MAANRPNFFNQIVEMWSRLQWRQRLAIIAFSLLGVVMIGSVVYFMNRVEYEALYRDLNPEDAQAIAAKLKEQKANYIVEGTSILVAAPKTEIDKLRLEISGSGLARSGRVGYEIFDKNQFGMTDFTEQINLQRALEGELARTISSLNEISQARVHIVLPKDSYFEESKESAKASVVLNLKRGEELSKSSISGIKGLVAGAVPGLHTYNVSIVDEQGRMLAQSMETGDAVRADMESGVREQLEKEMAGKVVSILEPLVGKQKIHANASIDIDFNSSEQTEETFNPNPSLIVSQQKSEERAGGSNGNSGIPGPQSNMGVASSQASTSSGDRLRQSETVNYEMNKLVRHTIQPKGMVRRLSVAVILDNKTVYTKSKNGQVIPQSVSRSEKELESYRELVLAAIGYNEQRGDVVTLENVAFFSDARPEEAVPAKPWYLNISKQPNFIPIVKYGLILLMFFFAYLIFIKPIRSRVFSAISSSLPIQSHSETAQLAEGMGQAKALPNATAYREEIAAPASAATPGLPAAEPVMMEDVISLDTATDEQIERELMREANSVDKGNRKYAAIKKKLTDKAKKDPEVVSQLIRSLLRERA
jgi:flagellar M-ring protein FliF